MKKAELVGAERRRRFSEDQKQAVVIESFGVGTTVAGTARRHDIAASLVYVWRKAYKDGSLEAISSDSGEIAVTPRAFAKALLPRTSEAVQEPIRLHVYEQIVVEIPAGADVAAVAALVRSLRE